MSDPFIGFDDEDAEERSLASAAPHYEVDDPVEQVTPMRFRPMAWGSLLMEVLLDPEKVDKILAAHNTTAEEVNDLLKHNTGFQTALREVKSRITAHGPNAGFVLRNQMLAEELLPTVYALASDKTVPPAVRLRAIENTVGWGRMDPKQDKNRGEASDTGAHFTMNFIGLDGPKIVSVESTRTIEADK